LRGKSAASGINIVLVARREDLLKEVGVEFSKRFGVEHRVIVLDVSRMEADLLGKGLANKSAPAIARAEA